MQESLRFTLVFILLAFSAFSSAQELATDLSGSGQAHNNMQPYLAVHYAIATDPSFSTDGASSYRILGEVGAFPYAISVGLPEGIPAGWTLADGRSLSIMGNEELFAVLGTTYGGDGLISFDLPDLRGRVPVGTGTGPGLQTVTLGQEFGVEEVALTVEQMVGHQHDFVEQQTPPAGGDQAHTNIMPSLGLRCLIANGGVFPSQSKPSGDSEQIIQNGQQAFYAEMRWYAGTFTLDANLWIGCNGQLLPISQNQALFSLVGTNYGGDGETDFGIPDLRGRVMVHSANGSNPRLGERGGNEVNALDLNQLPSHQHRVLELSPEAFTEPVGQGIAEPNQQPFTGINMLIWQFGEVFPSSTAVTDSILTGQMSYFAGNFSPRSTAYLSGQTLTIASNTALFALLLDTYGGDFMSVFNFPDARGRVLLGRGQGVALSDRALAEFGGAVSQILTVAEMPEHRHGVAPLPEPDPICWPIKSQNGGIVVNCL